MCGLPSVEVMTTVISLFDELECALSAGTNAERMAMLSRITDLFIAGANRYSAGQINLFDQLIARLVAVIESEARIKLANRLAPLANAPEGVIRMLAFDDNIKVARPVLCRSSRLLDADLVINASSKSQQHLFAISERSSLSEVVTDVLVARGNDRVVHSLARNSGARFSFAGLHMLVRRSSDDDALAMQVGMRSDLPRRHMLRLLDRASAAVRDRLLTENPGSCEAVQSAVKEVHGNIRSDLHQSSINYAAARAKIVPLHAAGQLDEAAIAAFAQEQRFEETAVGLSLLCKVEIYVVERALLSPGLEILLILVKLAGFSWATAQAILQLKAADRETSPQELETALKNFKRLNTATARRVLGFYNTRARGLTASAPAAAQV